MTLIGPDGTMRRRMVDTAASSDTGPWEELLARALAARAASPAFALTAGNSAAVAEVCSRLDGMPLAIELAAARCPALGPAQLAARLEGHPGLLAGGAARPGRHRSLEALVSWSYELLGDAERRLLARLSVLRGGFGLEVVERVRRGRAAGDRWAAGQPGRQVAGTGPQWRGDPLFAAGDRPPVRRRAASRLRRGNRRTCAPTRVGAGGARSADVALARAEWAGWSSRLTAEQTSIRAALSWGLGGHRAGGGTGTGRPARPVVDRHRPVHRSGPVPDHRGRHRGRGGSRHPGPGAARRRLVGVPPG